MLARRARKRLLTLQTHLSSSRSSNNHRSLSSSSSAAASSIIDLGGGIHAQKRPLGAKPLLIPKGYLASANEETLQHLRWLTQKDMIGQDIYLLGGPGPARRWLALSWAELMGAEVEYLALSRDTTESDLKQRREILNGAAMFVDQAPVRAAVHGRVLILEGIEKAERNVLPTLNNLLEDRSMALENGDFIMKSGVYDKLLASHSEAELQARRLRRCHPSFRVIALGLPVPFYHGRTLDPPLRSRFQCRVVDAERSASAAGADPLSSFTSTASLPWMSGAAATAPAAAAAAPPPPPQENGINPQLAIFVETLRELSVAQEGSGSGRGMLGSSLPAFPSWVLPHTNKLLNQFPGCGHGQALARVYPYLSSPAPPPSSSSSSSSSLSSPLSMIQGLAHKLGVDDMSVGPLFQAAIPVSLPSPTPPPTGRGGGGGGEQPLLQLRFEEGGNQHVFARGGELPPQAGPLDTHPHTHTAAGGGGGGSGNAYIETPTTRELLTAMVQEHALGRDICLLGTKGGGKSKLAQLFAHRLGYVSEIFPLFKDLTPRDLLQRRATDGEGNTTWEDSPLVTAAKTGRVCVLDGIHRLHPDTLATLQRLVQDREVELYDGTRLVRRSHMDMNEDDMARAGAAVATTPPAAIAGAGQAQGVLPIHPAFRIVALGQTEGTPTTKTTHTASTTTNAHYLHQDVLPLFSWLHLPPLPPHEHTHILTHAFPTLSPQVRDTLMAIEQGLGSKEEGEDLTLSTRQLMRLARRVSVCVSPQEALARIPQLVHETLLTNFASAQVREVVNDVLKRVGLREGGGGGGKGGMYVGNAAALEEESSLAVHLTAETLTIGGIQAPRRVPSRIELVPHPTPFYDNPRHLALLSRLLQDYNSGEKALLLVGNQGVGKNKVVDRFLELLNAEREYIQLHRDTTLHSLTVVPNLIDGKIVYEDSPLVRAVQHGRVLVVDEADKAPLEVVMVMKGLIEDGYLLLGDGRKVMASSVADAAAAAATTNTGAAAAPGGGGGSGATTLQKHTHTHKIIPIHPDFRLIVLANRPGFPFLGNDFFSTSGDVFCCHSIENPDLASEELLLASYAPHVPQSIRRRLALCFADLREMHQAGVLSYPYSIREAVALAKHIEAYPQDGIISALENVLGFDAYTHTDLQQTLADVFQRRGIPLRKIGARGEGVGVSDGKNGVPEVVLAEPRPLPSPVVVGQWEVDGGSGHAGVSVPMPVRQDAQLKGRTWSLPSSSTPGRYVMESSRMDSFAEEVVRLDLRPALGPYGAPLSLTVTTGQSRNSTPPPPLTASTDRHTHTHTHDADIHILASSPLRLLSYYNTTEGGSGHTRTLPLFTNTWGNFLDDDPYLIPLSSALGHDKDKVGVVFPKKKYMLVINARGEGGDDEGQARLIELPSFEGGSGGGVVGGGGGGGGGEGSTFSTWRMMMGGGGSGGGVASRVGGEGRGGEGGVGRVEVLPESKGGSRLVYYVKGGSSVSVMDLEKECVTHMQLRDPVEGKELMLAHVGVAPSGELLAWSSSSLLAFGEEGGGGEEQGADDGVYLLGGLKFVSGGGGVLVFDNEAAPATELHLKKITPSPSSSPHPAAPGSFACQSHVVASPPSSSFYMTVPGMVYQGVGPWSSSSSSIHKMDVLGVPRTATTNTQQAQQQQQQQQQLHARALKRIGHLVSMLSPPPPPPPSSSPSSAKHTHTHTNPPLSMEVTDPHLATSKSIPLHPHRQATHTHTHKTKQPPPLQAIAMEELGNGALAVLLNDHTLRFLEVDEQTLHTHLQDWRLMYRNGMTREEMLQHTHTQAQIQKKMREAGGESTPKTGTSLPKHGKEDAKNEPHVGGNTWAGGTGGSDTAGLGGRGGPYRLDKGHVVHQVSDEMKKQVSEEAKKEAARLGKEALAKRLKEIGMSAGDWALYGFIFARVIPQVQQLRQSLSGENGLLS